MLNPIVSIRHLNHYFGKGDLRHQILFDINLEIQPGEFVIMTGPSGSGKSTLLSLIGCLRAVQEGSLKILGQELKGATDQQQTQVRYHFGYIFQDSNLLKFLTAEQNIHVSLELNPDLHSAEIQERTHHILDTVGLLPQSHHYPHQLSGGQRQRIGIACALVNCPALVLADEPTAALDSRSGRRTVELMHRLAKERGSAVLMVTHDHRMLDVADRIIQLEDGCLELDYRRELTVAFPGLNQDHLERLVIKPTIATYPPGAFIFHKGDVPDNVYVVIQGDVQIVQENGNQPLRILQTIGRGGYFGEIGVLQGRGRTASVRVSSTSATRLMTIEKGTFLRLMQGSHVTSAVIAQEMQKRITVAFLLEALPNANVQQVMDILSQVDRLKYGPGSNIVYQGHGAEQFYIIMSGQVEVLQRDGTSEETRINILGPGHCFGGIDLRDDSDFATTIRATQQRSVEVMVLDRTTFRQLIERANGSNMERATVVYEPLKKVVQG